MNLEELKNFEKDMDKMVSSIDEIVLKEQARLRKIELIKSYKGDDQILHSSSFYQEAKDNPLFGHMSTGFKYLDDCLGGSLLPGQLVLISGFTNEGKTNFSFQLTKNMEQYKPLWFAYEESPLEIARKYIAYKQDMPNFYSPAKLNKDNANIKWIQDKIVESVVKFGTKVVFIDNLHYMFTSNGTDRQNTDLGDFAKNIKELAERTKTCIILLAHLRKSKLGIEYVPSYEDIQGDSNVAKIANKIICVWRPKKKTGLNQELVTEDNVTKISVQKVREAFGKKKLIEYSWDNGVYTEISMDSFVQELNKKREF